MGYRITKDSKTHDVKWLDGITTQGIDIILKSIKVGGAEAKNVKVVISTLSTVKDEADGLLGMSFLNRFHVTVDSKNNVLILKKK